MVGALIIPANVQAASCRRLSPNCKTIVLNGKNLDELKKALSNYGFTCVPNTIPSSTTADSSEKETIVIPSTTEQEQTTELSYAEQVVELVNKERAAEGLSALKLDKTVAAAAQVRAQEIETSFSHTRPSGKSFSTALTDAGVSYKGAGENIAWGQKTPEEVVEGWMNSSGHRANILNSKYTTIGVGYYQNANGTNYWSQLFTY